MCNNEVLRRTQLLSIPVETHNCVSRMQINRANHYNNLYNGRRNYASLQKKYKNPRRDAIFCVSRVQINHANLPQLIADLRGGRRKILRLYSKKYGSSVGTHNCVSRMQINHA